MTYLVPEGLYYTKEHEWAKVTTDERGQELVVVGITDYAQAKLGDVVYVVLPQLKAYSKGEVLAELEAYKGVSEVYAPVSGEVIERNDKLEGAPELINQDPYGKGWIAVIRPRELSSELPKLLDHKAYEEIIVGHRAAEKSLRSVERAGRPGHAEEDRRPFNRPALQRHPLCSPQPCASTTC